MRDHTQPTNQTLSGSLNEAVRLAEERAAEAIRNGDPEGAALTLRVAGHMQRLAPNHRAAALIDGPDNDPVQVG